jgi:hypothetical protein
MPQEVVSDPNATDEHKREIQRLLQEVEIANLPRMAERLQIIEYDKS